MYAIRSYYAGSKLTLQSAVINVSDSAGQCAIEFAGSGNQLILSGSSKVYSGSTRAGVEVTGSITVS